MSRQLTEQAQQSPALEGLTAQIDGLREVGAMLWQRGWSVGTSSNYSVVVSREPLELLVTASGKDKGRLTRGDLDCRNNVTERTKTSPQSRARFFYDLRVQAHTGELDKKFLVRFW